ncbi:MAG: alpha/beta hydrolase [Anaerolineales bacterium]|nr:alpha/beta hydrolase [Anaerolineales bacterium]
MKNQFAELNGTKFYYELAGEGEMLVLIHAGICDSRMWDDQFAAFAEHYRVLRYDWRGAGQTAVVDTSFSHHDDLYAILNHLEITKAHLVGCSIGGTIAIDFALAFPEKVISLTTVNSTPRGLKFDDPPPPQWDEVDVACEAGDWERASELEVQIWVDGSQRTPDQVDGSIRDKVRAMNLIQLLNDEKELGEERPLSPPAYQQLNHIQQPTLIVNSDLDMPRIGKAADFMAADIPNSTQVTVTGTAHLPNMEKPDEFNQIVLDFLRRHPIPLRNQMSRE